MIARTEVSLRETFDNYAAKVNKDELLVIEAKFNLTNSVVA